MRSAVLATFPVLAAAGVAAATLGPDATPVPVAAVGASPELGPVPTTDPLATDDSAPAAHARRPGPDAHQSGPDAQAFLASVAGTPPVACELVVQALDSRRGGAPVRPRVHPAQGGSAEQRALAEWARSNDPSPADLEALLAGLSHSDACVRQVAARLVGLIADPTVADRLARMTRTASGGTRLAALAALAWSRDERATATVEEALASSDAEVRRAAAWALGASGRRTSPDGLIRSLRDADPLVRENAAWALGRTNAREASTSLEGTLADPMPGVRINAAWALGQLRQRSSVDPLARLLAADPDAEVRRAAAWALGRIDD